MIKISDHVVVRYLERIKGLDIEGIRQQITESLDTPHAQRLIEFSGSAACRIKTGDVTYCMRGRTVTTGIHLNRAVRLSEKTEPPQWIPRQKPVFRSVSPTFPLLGTGTMLDRTTRGLALLLQDEALAVMRPTSPIGLQPVAERSERRRPGGRADTRACAGCA